MSLWMRVRQNLSLKIISLVTAILLYIYVQQERNPTIFRTLQSSVEYRNLQPGYEVTPASQSVTIVVTGPRRAVELLKDGDVKASADIGSLSSNQPSSNVRVTYELPKAAANVTIDSGQEFVKVQVFRQKSRKVPVLAIFKMDSPAGLKYGDPIVRPAVVTVRGREDRVNRVDRVVATAAPTEPRAGIDGDFALKAWDGDNNVVEDIDIEPSRVHVTVPQVPEPSEKTVFASAICVDQPVPPYSVTNTVITPSQVKIIGTPDRLAQISSVGTETLSIKDLTATTTLDASLIIPPDIEVHDMEGRRLKRVKVKFTISKASPPAGGTPNPPLIQPKHDGPAGP